MTNRSICCALLLATTLILTSTIACSEESIITEAESYACMGADKSRKQTENEALVEAKRKASEYTLSYIASETKTKNFQMDEDIVKAYSNAVVKILEANEGWYQDKHMGDCFRVQIKAEIIPDKKVMKNIHQKDDPLAPLNVQVWTDKENYTKSQKMKIYIKSNKPFYARLVYQDSAGGLTQLLPNPYRKANYFNGGVIYEIPSGEDRFDLKITPPFGEDEITLYASSSPLGNIELKNAGGVYEIKTRANDISWQTRAIVIEPKNTSTPQKNAAEFSEVSIGVKTSK